MKLSQKSKKRSNILNKIIESLTESYDIVNYRRLCEDKVKIAQYTPLLNTIKNLFKEKGCSSKTACKKAKESLIWEGNNHQTLSNVKLFSVNHRPDFLIEIDGMKIAVEIKKGEKGYVIREGIGQSIVYSRRYDFTILMFIDCTKDKKIKNSLNNDDEMSIIEDLWENFNVNFCIV
jgi:hypothetical protein